MHLYKSELRRISIFPVLFCNCMQPIGCRLVTLWAMLISTQAPTTDLTPYRSILKHVEAITTYISQSPQEVPGMHSCKAKGLKLNSLTDQGPYTKRTTYSTWPNRSEKPPGTQCQLAASTTEAHCLNCLFKPSLPGPWTKKHMCFRMCTRSL